MDIGTRLENISKCNHADNDTYNQAGVFILVGNKHKILGVLYRKMRGAVGYIKKEKYLCNRIKRDPNL